jgi:hypothetical protein
VVKRCDNGVRESGGDSVSDLSNVGFVKFRLGALAAVWMTVLQSLVFVVFGHRSGAKVGRITTRRVIARVHDVFAGRNNAVRQLICHAVRAELSLVVVGDDTVAAAVDGPLPRPTGVRFSRLVEVVEAFAQCPSARGITARLRAERMFAAAARSQATLPTHDIWDADSAEASTVGAANRIWRICVALRAMCPSVHSELYIERRVISE